MAAPYVHSHALVDSDQVGQDTKIWAFAQVMKGAKIGQSCNIGGHAFIEGGAVIGDRVTIKNQVMVWDGVTIQDDVFVGPGVIFTNDRQPRSPRMQGVQAVTERYHHKASWLVSTVIERGVSIGAGAVITPGVTIGAYSMIGAGAVVTKSTATHSLMLGNPAVLAGWVCLCGRRLDRSRAMPGPTEVSCECLG